MYLIYVLAFELAVSTVKLLETAHSNVLTTSHPPVLTPLYQTFDGYYTGVRGKFYVSSMSSNHQIYQMRATDINRGDVEVIVRAAVAKR